MASVPRPVRAAACRPKGHATTTERGHEELLRRLAISDEAALVSCVVGVDAADARLGPKTAALIRLAALVATGAEGPSYQWVIGAALACGADEFEIVDVLSVVAPMVGVARVTAAAQNVAAAIGYELDEDL